MSPNLPLLPFFFFFFFQNEALWASEDGAVACCSANCTLILEEKEVAGGEKGKTIQTNKTFRCFSSF
jgi:hypothetical protein